MKHIKCLKWIIVLMVLVCVPCLSVKAAEKQTIYNSPYVRFSGDGRAWTTNAGDKDYAWYPMGTTVKTEIKPSLHALLQGQHYYKTERIGEIPIGKWKVSWSQGRCIHDDYPLQGDKFHDISFSRKTCFRQHYSGWTAYCADCGESLTPMLIYMSRQTAESIDYLDVEEGRGYYYLCPHCTNLEQGVEFGTHSCKAVSWNRYLVHYDKNTADVCGGGMPDSAHMYNDATEYDGETVIPVTHLTLNNYTRIGYKFMGWNTKPDGSGRFYADGAEVYNLTDKDIKIDGDEAVVTLYAQWQASKSTLKISPNGGKYDGKSFVTSVVGSYGEQYLLDTKRISAPDGYTVSFQVNGGQRLSPVTGTTHFVEWSREQPFQGEFVLQQGVGAKYIFNTPDGNVDTLNAVYAPDAVVLPEAVKAGSSFGGWYYDTAFTRPAGGAGEKIIPAQNLTLYAQWVNLALYSKDNYSANNRKGAVDLSWSQADTKSKVYKVYQRRDTSDWMKINDAGDISSNSSVSKVFEYCGSPEKYTVPHTGLYTLTADGAQGGDYGKYRGGYGGRVSMKVWLLKGEKLTFVSGGQNGYNGGGRGRTYGTGGGYSSVSSDKKGLLLIAGGGGGAAPNGNGGAGGSETSVVSGKNGQSGQAGGGGGYRGGTAGEEIIHHHARGTCPYHTHTGNAEKGGGCFQKAVTSIGTCTYEDCGWRTDGTCGMVHCNTCGGLSPGTNHCHWYEHSACGGSDGHWGYTTCARGHTVKSWGTYYSGTHSYSFTAYQMSCSIKEGWNCQYKEGEIVSSKRAYGGNNYVNEKYAYLQTSQAGIRAGNGTIKIQSDIMEFVDDLSISGVKATDFASPGKVENITTRPISAGTVELCWEEPKDAGTVYFHYVESYMAGTAGFLCRSNTVQNTLYSGVKGYFILLDTNPKTVVTDRNGTFQANRSKTVSLKQGNQFLHVAVVDMAGNVSGTTHVSIGSGEELAWKLHTRPIQITDGENVYPGQEKGSYYVRSDGLTPFLLKTDSYLDGIASEGYQINYSVYESKMDGEETNTLRMRNIIRTPSSVIREEDIRTEAKDLIYATEGRPILTLYPYSYTVRSRSNRNMTSVQKFTLNSYAAGKRITVIPRAGADRNAEVIWSDGEKDAENGIVLIGDAEAPVISGMDILADKELINRPGGKVRLDISARDDLSGVKDLYVKIRNTDNMLEEVHTPDENGRVSVDITREIPIFSGDFTVTVYASDNVGNECQMSAGTTEFALSAGVERILEPHEPAFKCGESGILTVTTWGYAERIEVEFPGEMSAKNPDLNKVFDYKDAPEHVREEKIQFTIPLDTPENKKYTITVRAYKGDKRLEDHPTLNTIEVEGSILDELRTRLR